MSLYCLRHYDADNKLLGESCHNFKKLSSFNLLMAEKAEELRNSPEYHNHKICLHDSDGNLIIEYIFKYTKEDINA
jgi:hypothetical protein